MIFTIKENNVLPRHIHLLAFNNCVALLLLIDNMVDNTVSK